MKGVPLRLELGPRDIENGVATAVRRDNGEKFAVSLENIEQTVRQLMDDIRLNMYEKAKAFRDSHVKEAHNMEELEKILNGGNFAKVMWTATRLAKRR